MKIPAFKPLYVGLVAALLLLLTGAQMYRCLQSYFTTSHAILHTREVLAALNTTALAVKDVESGQRAYVNTGQTIFIAQQPYELNQVRAALDKVYRLTADDPDLGLRGGQLASLARERLLPAVSASEYRAADSQEAGSKVSMANINALLKPIGEMQLQARALLKRRSGQADALMSNAEVFAALLVCGVLAAIVLLYGWAIRKATRPTRVAVPASRVNELTFGMGGKWGVH